MSTLETRLAHAKVISEEWESNSFPHDLGYFVGQDPETLAQNKYACVLRSESQSWVLGADSMVEICHIIISTFQSDGTESEWFDSAWDLDTGKEVVVPYEVSFTVTLKDGTVVTR